MNAAPGSMSPSALPAAEIARWLSARLASQSRLQSDSRAVRVGDAFFAWPGQGSDGRAFIDRARAQGAAAIVAEARGASLQADEDLQLVAGLREQAGEIAAHYYGQPCARLDLIAVTGTNGKTSCSHWIAQGLARSGRRAALIGTLGSGVLDPRGVAALHDFGLTMPDALTLQAMLAEFVAQDVHAVVMEASSIGLHQHRLSGAQPAVAVFTNLSRDHLDYHGTEEAYAQAKLLLFKTPSLKTAVLNAQDPLSARALSVLPAGCRAIAYGHARTAWSQHLEQLIASRIEQTPQGLLLDIEGDFGARRVKLSLLGHFNAVNALAVAASWLAVGYSIDDVVEQLSLLRPVAGRLERVSLEDKADQVHGGPVSDQPEPNLVCAVVDYAHTPDALAQALAALRPLARARGGQLWCVFGAGGARDPGKRPLMGAVASQAADRVILTNDNPRSEDPQAILRAIASGLAASAHTIEPDRARAIARALSEAAPVDVVLIAGKGHERWQEFAHERLPFDDVAQARLALQRLAGARHA